MPWEETENEIRHRLRDPADFRANSFRRITLEAKKPRVYAVVGKLKGETKTTVQSLRFPKQDGWSVAKAKQWLQDHYKASADFGAREEMTMKIPIQPLEAEFTDVSSGGETRTARLKWYTGATVKRRGWDGDFLLTLSMEPDHVRMERLQSGKAPLLNSHSDYSLKDIIGVVESANLKGEAEVRFSNRDDVTSIWDDVQNKIIRNASVGTRIYKLRDVTEKDEQGNEKTKAYLAVDWEPLEVSLVPIGADPDAGFGLDENARFTEAEIISESIQGAITARKGAEMPEENVGAGSETRSNEQIVKEAQEAERERLINAGRDAERARVQTINETTKALKLRQSFADQHIKSGSGVETYRKLAIDQVAIEEERRRQQEIKTPADDPRLQDEADARRLGMIGALLNRYQPGCFAFDEKVNDFVYRKTGGQELFDGARQYVSLSLLDVAKECLAAMGIRWQIKSRMQIATLAFQTSSDFPNILANTANKSLRAGYQMADSQWRLIAARRTAPDFKTVSELTLDGSATLEAVAESGEFKRGRLVEGKETWTLKTYGKIIAITRQAIINDDLGAFTRTPFLLGQEVAVLERDTVIGIITTNGELMDMIDLFDEMTHKNHITVPAAISVDSIGALRVNMMLQTSPGGKTLGITPKFLVSPATTGQLALQYCSANYQASESAKINPWAGILTPIIEPKLDATSVSDWYLFADPNDPNGTVLVYAYLEGQEGPYTETREGFDVDGTEIKIRHDFAAAAVDYRGAAKQSGS